MRFDDVVRETCGRDDALPLTAAPVTLDTEMCVCMDAGQCSDPLDCGSWNTCQRPRNRAVPHPLRPEPGDPHPHPHERIAIHALALLHEAEAKMVGKYCITTAGIGAVIQAVRLNNEHGLTYQIEGSGFAPVSTIRSLEGT